MPLARDVDELLFGSNVRGFGARWRLWSARRATRMATNAVAVGQRAKVEGVAGVLEHVVPAPFTQRPALAWRTMLEQKLRHDHPPGFAAVPGGTTWQTRIRESFSVPFVLEDDDGRIVIDGSAIAALRLFDVGDHPKVNDDNPRLREYLHARGIQSSLFIGAAGDHRFLEAVVVSGDRIAVWGRVRESTRVASTGYRDAASRTLVITGTADDPCVLTRGPDP
jgi:hypothetical protein